MATNLRRRLTAAQRRRQINRQKTKVINRRQFLFLQELTK
jgi:hypothetical protein